MFLFKQLILILDLMMFPSLTTRGHHVMARPHGRDYLDSTKLHRANIRLFLYVLSYTVMLLHPILTNNKNCTQVSRKIRRNQPHWLHFVLCCLTVHVWMWGSLCMFSIQNYSVASTITASSFFYSSVIKLCYRYKLGNFAWQKNFKILHHWCILIQCTSQGPSSLLACIYLTFLFVFTGSFHSNAVTSVALFLSL